MCRRYRCVPQHCPRLLSAEGEASDRLGNERDTKARSDRRGRARLQSSATLTASLYQQLRDADCATQRRNRYFLQEKYATADWRSQAASGGDSNVVRLARGWPGHGNQPSGGGPGAQVHGQEREDAVLTQDEARELLEKIDTFTLLGLRDRALIAMMIYTFGRVGAVIKMRVEDYYTQGRRGWVRLHRRDDEVAVDEVERILI